MILASPCIGGKYWISWAQWRRKNHHHEVYPRDYATKYGFGIDPLRNDR